MNEKNYNYTKLTPFKLFVLENFPFIEADFDALTEWQLFCKIGNEINKIIDSTNSLGTQVVSLTDYVSNYFENLNVQDEINNKLNEMAEDGTLAEIIAQYVNVQSVLAFNNVAELKNANNLINGSICKTLGYSQIFDQKGSFYKIRNVVNSDKIDENNLIALKDVSLVAEKINEKKDKKYLFIGDSYANGVSNNTIVKSWVEYVVDYLNLKEKDYYKVAENGIGFYHVGVNGHNFKTLLENESDNINYKYSFTDIVLCGGINDSNETYDNIQTSINDFIEYCKIQYPFAQIHFGMISNTSDLSAKDTRENLNVKVLRNYQYANVNYLNGVENILKYYYFISEDKIHPTQTGYEYLGKAIAQALKNGSVNWTFNENANININNSNLATNELNFLARIFGNILYISSVGSHLIFNNSVNEQNDTVILGDLSDNVYFRRTEVQTFAIHTYAKFILDGGESYGCPILLNVNDENKLYLKPYLYNINGQGKINFTGIKEIIIEPFNLSIPVQLS